MSPEVARSVTDLILGLAAVALAVGLERRGDVHRFWRVTLWCAGAAALVGAAYHGPLHDSGRLAEAVWVVVGVLVVAMLSYLLAGSVLAVLGPGRGRVFVLLRSAGLAAYLAAALVGRGGLHVLLVCESLTMAAVLGLWIHAARRRHPMAAGMVAAILASALAGVVFALPDEATRAIGLDSTSLSHLAQIPGLVLLYVAVARDRDRARRPRRHATGAGARSRPVAAR